MDTIQKMYFGNYIHKYYYNQSIADGYTLKLIREEIETTYKKPVECYVGSNSKTRKYC